MTVAEFNAELEAWRWRDDREMERLAWLAWHFLIPWQKKGSKLTPKDLLPEPPKTTGRTRDITPADRRRELKDLMKEMEVED